MPLFLYPFGDPQPERFRKIGRIPFERLELNSAALLTACDEYEAATGDVDEVAFGRALMTYLEGAEG